MPKRVKTPPPPDDEPRYLTVVHPYPLNANLMLHADRRKLALWLACCTEKDVVLLAMYHKPTSPGMVIIEVDRDFEQFDKLLGKHEWSKFLLKPTREEADKTSKVFWCHYNSGRLVQKHGWKRVDIEEHWFTNWNPNNDVISSPYPKTTYCEVPSEAKTGVPLCRPLPQAQFPVPPPDPEPRVGSAEWTYAKSSGTASVTTSSSRRGRGKMAGPSDTVSMISSTGASSSYSGAVRPPQPPAAPPVPAQQMASYRAKQAWSRGPPSTASTSITSPPASRAPSTIGSGQGSRAHSARAPANPPGLTMKYQRLNWADDVERSQAGQDDEPTTPSASTSSFNLSSGVCKAPHRRAPDPEGPIDPDQEYEYQDDRPKRSTLLAMKEAFDSAAMADNGDNLPPATWGIEDNGITEDDPNPWNGYKATKWEPPTKVNRKGPDREEWKCPDHGPMCNPGICKERARIELERRRLKEHEERMEKKRIRNEKWEQKKLKDERKLARAEGTYDEPPHSASRQRSTSGSDSSSSSNSTGSETDRDGSHNEDEYPPPAGPDPEDWSGNRPPFDHGDDEPPKVNLGVGNRTTSVSSKSYDEGTQGVSPSFPSDDGHSFKSGWTTSTNAKKDNVSRGTAADRQPPADARSVAASVRSAASSDWSLPGQRDSGWAIRSAASLRSTAPSISNEGSSSSAQRQRSGNPRSPSVHTTISSVVSERPTGADAASVSQSSSGTGKRPPERDSRSSTTLQNTPPSTRGKRSTGTDKNSQTRNIAEWCEKASVSCGSTNAPSVISSRPSTPTEARSAVSSRPSAPTEARSVVSSRPPTLSEGRSVARSSTSARTVVSTNSSAPTEGGFPTFDNTEWGDPITASQHQRCQASGRSHSEKDAELESDDSAVVETEKKGNESSQNAGSGKKYRVRTKRKAKPTAKMADDPQEDTLSVALGVKLEPGGPGSSWGDVNTEW